MNLNTTALMGDRTSVLLRQEGQLQLLRLLKPWFALMAGEAGFQPLTELTEVLNETPAQTELAAYLKQDAACADLINNRYIPPAYDLRQLLNYAPESLGYQFAASIQEQGFDPNLHAGMTAETDGKYVEVRLSQTHDIWHVVTGFDTSEIGEIALQAFHLPQFPYPFAAMLVANSLVTITLHMPEQLPSWIEAIAEGLAMGKKAKPLFAQKWEEGWHKSVSQWRTELGIHPIPQT